MPEKPASETVKFVQQEFLIFELKMPHEIDVTKLPLEEQLCIVRAKCPVCRQSGWIGGNEYAMYEAADPKERILICNRCAQSSSVHAPRPQAG